MFNAVIANPSSTIVKLDFADHCCSLALPDYYLPSFTCCSHSIDRFVVVNLGADHHHLSTATSMVTVAWPTAALAHRYCLAFTVEEEAVASHASFVEGSFGVGMVTHKEMTWLGEQHSSAYYPIENASCLVDC